jgi:hypothetical protein
VTAAHGSPAMSFTEALRSLEGPEEARWGAVERLMAGLRDALCTELRRRGLWDSPPSYLGILGSPRWDDEALDELAEECYLFNLARLRSLRAQLRLKANVDGFVLLNVRHFVFERQRAHDPLGYRLYEVLAGAAERLLDAGTLHLLAGGPKLRNETVLGFTPGRGARQAGAEELTAIACAWNDELLEALLAPAGGGDRTPGAERVAERLAELPRRGIAAFRFGDLLDPWKRDARARWARRADDPGGRWAREEAEEGALLRLVRAVEPDTAVEERESFARLVSCVAARLRAGAGGGEQGELWALWSCIAAQAADPAREQVPSQRAVATATGVARHRLPALYAELGRLIDECRARSGAAKPGETPVKQAQPAAAADETRP